MNHARLDRLARAVMALTSTTPDVDDRDALLAQVIKKADDARLGIRLPASDWTTAPAAVANHRGELLRWLQMKTD